MNPVYRSIMPGLSRLSGGEVTNASKQPILLRANSLHNLSRILDSSGLIHVKNRGQKWRQCGDKAVSHQIHRLV
jgi:hypothetical protein